MRFLIGNKLQCGEFPDVGFVSKVLFHNHDEVFAASFDNFQNSIGFPPADLGAPKMWRILLKDLAPQRWRRQEGE
jgi:hypothetical protein